MEFAGGALIMFAFIVIAFIGLVIGYFTQRGSGITARPYGKIYSSVPGAKGPSEISGRDPKVRLGSVRGLR